VDVPSLWGSRWYRQQHIRHRRSLRDIALNLIFSDSPVSAAHLIFFTAACVTIHPSLFCPTASHYISLQKFFSTPIRKHFATHNFASKQALCSVLFTTQRQFQEGACSCEAPITGATGFYYIKHQTVIFKQNTRGLNSLRLYGS